MREPKSLRHWVRVLVDGPPPKQLPLALHELRPRRGAELSELANRIDGRGWRAALPTAFSDDLLLHLLHDFRSAIDAVTEERAENLQSLKPVTYVLRKLLLQHPKPDGDVLFLFARPDAITRAMQVYQDELERELARRMIGIGVAKDSEQFAECLWRALES